MENTKDILTEREREQGELALQLEFYNTYLPRVDKNLSIDQIQNYYTDGIINGNILEFKVKINNLNAVLFQTIKYLSRMRIKGIPVPKNILLISFSTFSKKQAYIYNSGDFLDHIEKVYIGAASINNSDFHTDKQPKELDLNSDAHQEELIGLLKEKHYTKINIDENCIVGWANKFFSENPGKTKQDFIGDNTGKTRTLGEIRDPNIFAKFINPYKKDSNVRFEYLMDQLNTKIQQKNLGAFYTPKPYVIKAYELLRAAISEVPEGNDYIILDRCAGTGNLEKWLTDEELSHVIVSTYEYYEYKVLVELLGDKVRHIIPPIENDNTFQQGFVNGANALSEEYIKNETLNKYINDPKCSIIVFENPPYVEPTSMEQQKLKTAKESRESWKNYYVVQKIKEESKLKGSEFNELANYFILSAFEYYIRQKGDALVVFSPVKYFKWQNLVSRKIGGGFGFNRKHFHAGQDFVSCIWWKFEKEEFNQIEVEVFDIDTITDQLIFVNKVKIKKVHALLSQSIYKYKKADPQRVDPDLGLACDYNGLFTKKSGKSLRGLPRNLDDSNFIGYIQTKSFSLHFGSSALIRAKSYDENGFWINKNNFLVGLLAFTAAIYKTIDNDWSKNYLAKTGDGFSRFLSDLETRAELKEFLLRNLFFVSLTNLNHIRSLEDPKNKDKIYLNELSLDNLDQKPTLALNTLKNYKRTDEESEIENLWFRILDSASKTSNYRSDFKYGLYQIIEELNTKTLIGSAKSNKYIYDYPELNGNIEAIKQKLKKYYLEEIAPILFEYEFLK
ncbi:hypothetical protein Q4504_03315 [Mesomycoplasma ovipneumoniae]|uniref:hypothetical protein n=1 Tax=Mesomycoplasma ovipneumoniae TaxID=29562 RepID=UPI0026E434DA|nr:hypothetical protein [Mesomycoplasma ovipneumoniae]MDO6857483.1 hypothetical protein [Mesomycoplasma ovipneumoniae]